MSIELLPILGFFTGGGPGFWEILLILAAMLLLFGKRLPEVGRSLGKGLVEFKRGLKSVEDEANSVDVEVSRKQAAGNSGGGSRNLNEGTSHNATTTGTATPVNNDEKTNA